MTPVDETATPLVSAIDPVTPVITSDITAESALDAAIAYRHRGWEPIPIQGGSKNPGYDDWQTIHFEDHEFPERFRSGSNVGLLLGSLSGGLIDVDIDCPEALAIASKILPPTDMVSGRAGSQRSHYWYVTDGKTSKFKDPNKTKNSMLIELRSTGCQTVVPPSIHPNGEEIVWYQSGSPATVAYDDLKRRVTWVAAAALIARYWPGTGSRQEAGLALSGTLLRGGLSIAECETLMRLVALAAGDEERDKRIATVRDTAAKLESNAPATGGPALTEIIGPKTVARMSKWLGLRSAVEVVDWEPPARLTELERPSFPIQALPGWWREWVEAESIATQTPTDLPAMISLAVCATAVAKRAVVQVSEEYREPLCLFVVAVAPSAGRKSPVFTTATKVINRYQDEEARRLGPEIAQEASRYRIAQQVLEAAEKDAAKAKPGERESAIEKAEELARELALMHVPALPQLRVDDCTPERLASIMARQGGRIAALAPEGELFNMMAGRYSGNVPNINVYLRGHAGEDLLVDRGSRPPDVIRAATMTICLTVQPSVIQGLAATPDFRGRGLLGRFLYTIPVTQLGSRDANPPAMPTHIQKLYESNVETLLRMEPASRDASGEPEPHRLRLDDDAFWSMIGIRGWMEPQLKETGELGHMTDWAGKWVGAVIRIAGILHLANLVGDPAPWKVSISNQTFGNALMIGKYLIPHAKAAFTEMGASKEVTDAQHLLRWIKDHQLTEFSKKSLFDMTRGRFKKAADLDLPLNLLQEHGYVRLQPEPPRSGVGRRPSPRYEVNPLWLEGK